MFFFRKALRCIVRVRRLVKVMKKKRWFISSNLDASLSHGFFAQKVFELMHHKGHQVAGYLGQHSCQHIPEFSQAQYVPSELGYSESQLIQAIQSISSGMDVNLVNEVVNDVEIYKSFLRCSNRSMSFPRDISFRDRIFYLSVEFWICFVKVNQIDACFFYRIPHFAFDSLLANIAIKLGISIYYLDRTDFKRLYFVRRDWNTTDVLLSEKNASYLDASLATESGWKEISKEMNNASVDHNSNMDKSFFYRISNYFQTTKSTFRSIIEWFTPSNFYKLDGAVYLTPFSKYLIPALIIYRSWQSRALWSNYKKHTANFKLPTTFLFFPLHVQPEQSTDPAAGKYANLEYTIRMIARTLPLDWKLVIKEHPRQFDDRIIGVRKITGRDINFYKRLSEDPNILFAPLELDSKYLINKSMGCLVINGSVGYEALRLGKSVGCFGTPWYLSLRETYLVRCDESLSNFINRLFEEGIGYINSPLTKEELVESIKQYCFSAPSNFSHDSFDFYEKSLLEKDARVLCHALDHDISARFQADNNK